MTLNSSGPTTAVTVDEARKSDQLPSSIASENNIIVTLPQAALISRIKAHIAKGDNESKKAEHASKKAEQHYIAAGQHLKELKGDLSQAEFLEIVREKIGIGKSRTYELLAIADGTKTVDQVRDQTNVRKIKHRQSVRSGTDNADEPEASAEAMKAKFAVDDAAKDAEQPERDEVDLFVSKLMKLDRDLARTLYDLLWNDRYSQKTPDLLIQLKRALGLDGDADDVQEAKANPPRQRGKKNQEICLSDAINNAFDELQNIGGECRESVDSAPEGLNATQRVETLDETANVLEGLEEPDVSAELAEIKVSLPKHRKPRYRPDRWDIALGILAACIEALDNIDESDPRHQEACDLRSELESASTDAEMCAFPGTHG
jgi:hypothetical protein